MFSKLASELQERVNKYIQREGKLSGTEEYRLTCCKINDISVCVDVWVYHNRPKDEVNIGIAIETCMGMYVGNNFNNHRLYTETIVKEVKPDKVNYEEIYEKIYDIIPKLRISKIKGKFLLSDDVSLAVADELSKLFTHPNVELSTCCVCLEMCGGVITKCGHLICIYCITHLIPKKDEDEDEDEDEDCCHYTHCPLCRAKIGS